ncbi:MAG: helix-turn-helix transcriptional regulator [Synergistaceae bacterium]|nr:helix-turn-helix transcriptional regulator [Synergistaceae bacterium]
MTKRTNKRTEKASLCPLKHLMNTFSGKWKIPILCILAGETAQRYSTVKRRLGNVTDVMLSQSLHDLEAAGIIHREQFNEIPPHVEYSLTEKGRDFLPLLTSLAEWAVKDMERESLPPSCAQCLETE